MGGALFRSLKYGMFVHYVAKLSCRADGTIPQTADETADNFDAEKFAADIETFGVEYVIFTAWHFNAHCLYP
jgi:alpha-L-fucosidase